MIYRPTPKQIYEYMIATYNGYLLPVKYIDDYFFTVFIPSDFYSLYISESRTIIQRWMDIIGNKSYFRIIDWFMKIKKNRIYIFQKENIFTYDWFILLSICSENNLIVDSVQIDSFEGTIYDIEPASKRLKVRL